jgi:hypothetical protein
MFFFCVAARPAQTPVRGAPGTLLGLVMDPSGALVPGAEIHVERRGRAMGRPSNVMSDAMGNYAVTLAPGVYDVTFVSPGFEPLVRTVRIGADGGVVQFNAKLVIATAAEQVMVDANGNSTGADANQSALVLGEKELSVLSDDDATFQQQVLALAGADPLSPAGVYVDGFSGGAIPPKQSIRQIRINQNPFSAQYPEVGFGRVEVFTRPGTAKLHGHLQFTATGDALNTRNPFPYPPAAQPPYLILLSRGNLSGPLGKKTSVFVASTYNDVQNNSVIHALATDTSNAPYSAIVSSPTTNTDESVRLDRLLAPNNTLTARYEVNHTSETDCGLAGCATQASNGQEPAAVSSQILPSEAYDSGSTAQTLQLTDSQTMGKSRVLDTRFQWIRVRLLQTPLSTAATLNVNGYFNGGGSPAQRLEDHTDRTEFQEYFQWDSGKQFLRMGGRYRGLRDANLNTAGYNGAYTYSPNATGTVTALANYNAGAPSQFTITTGTPSAVVYTGDLALFAEDEWKARENVTLDFGFRLESQSGVPDHFDPAPRVGASWAIGQTAKRPAIVVLRAGFGLFYDRFAAANLLTAIRQQSGTVQQSYVFTLSGTTPAQCIAGPVPSCPNSTSTPTLYDIDPQLRTQYQTAAGVTAERSFGPWLHMAVYYMHYQGSHDDLSRNINAPLPGTFVPGQPNSGVRPLGGTQNIYQFTSEGSHHTNQVFGNTQMTVSKRITLFTYTTYANDVGDNNGATSFPSNQYRIADDTGRRAVARERAFFGGSMQLPWGISASPFVVFSSRQPFNITTGVDRNGDTIYNDRPSFATAASPAGSVYKTAYGTFNASPVTGETIIPVNYANGPRFNYTQIEFSKTVTFGPRPVAVAKAAPKPPRYSLSCNAEIDNVFNHTNAGIPVGVLTSPDFGKSLALNGTFIGSPNANRMVRLGLGLSF